MNNMDTIPGYNADSAELLKNAADRIYHRYITENHIYPLLLSDAKVTRNHLNRAGMLYQSVQSSIRFAQYRRAVWYIRALDKFCRYNFGANHCQAAQTRINGWLA